MTMEQVRQWIGRPLPIEGPQLSNVTFRQAAEHYLQKGGDARYLQPIVNHFGDRHIASIFPGHVWEMADALYPIQSNATKNRCALTPARAVINHGYAYGWCNRIMIKRFKEPTPAAKEPANVLWLHLFIRQCEKDRLHHLAALVLFMAQTAARVSETIELRWSEVSLQERRALLLKTKTETNSVRGLTDELVNRLQELRQGRDYADRVFRFTNRHSVNERIKAVCRRAGIKYKSCHVCGRHTFATTAIEMGIDVRTAMEAGGWKSSSIFLETYVRPRVNSGRLVADRFNAIQFESVL
jgi:Phage integrase family